MAISSYQKDGKTLWRVYIDVRSRRDRTLRVQRRINGIETEKAAQETEKKLFRELTQKLVQLEAAGLRWREVIERWVRHQELYGNGQYVATTLIDYSSLLRNWTAPWLDRVASEITHGDGITILNQARTEGKSSRFCQHLKSVIHLVFTWAINEKLIKNATESPVTGVEVKRGRGEKLPEILTIDEIRTLLQKAKEQDHPWYSIWVMAVFTGCRNGELQALKRYDVESVSREDAIKQDSLPAQQRRYGLIRVRRSWNTRTKTMGPTKAGYWRSVPISSELYWFLINELHIDQLQPDDFLLPHHYDWTIGLQAQVLRGFCKANKLPSVRFHALRACFATQLIATGVPPTVVMKIAGWKDMKTMQHYIRLAGVDEAGATETLHFIPTSEAVMEHVVNIIDYRDKK